MLDNKLATRLSEIKAKGGLKREASVGKVDAEARTAELAFSSEVEYRRWFGIEVLDHGQSAVDLSRLNNKAALLWNHDWNDQRGVVEFASVDSDRKGRAMVRFSRSPAGEQLMQDVIDGIVTKVSVGYEVRGMKLLEERSEEDVYLVNDWMPYEISMVSIPADDTVGVGRSMEIPLVEAIEVVTDNSNEAGIQQPIQRAETNMDEAIRNDEAVNQAEKRGLEAERARVRELTDMGRAYGESDLAIQFVSEGKTAGDLQRALLDKLTKERSAKPLDAQEKSAHIGMTDKDVRQYSLLKAVRALANPNDKRAQEAAAFEIECGMAAQEKYGKEARGILIPQDVLSRAFNAGGAANTPTGATSGAELVATELLAGSFIEMLRNKTTIMRRASLMGGLVGNVEISKQTGGATGYWLAEGADATEGTPTLGQIALSPKTVAAYTDITRRLMMQSTPDAEAIVRSDLINALAQTIDYAGYYGSGLSNQPKGIKNYSGLNALDFAAAAPTFAELVGMESLIAADNADVNSMAYVFNAAMRGYLKTTPKFGTGTETTIWEPGNMVNGYATDVTNQVAAGDVFFGNFKDLLVGLWGGLDLIVDTSSLSKSGGTRIVVFQDVDFALRRVESLCYGSATVVP